LIQEKEKTNKREQKLIKEKEETKQEVVKLTS